MQGKSCVRIEFPAGKKENINYECRSFKGNKQEDFDWDCIYYNKN